MEAEAGKEVLFDSMWIYVWLSSHVEEFALYMVNQ
jgi:hypothetical protein